MTDSSGAPSGGEWADDVGGDDEALPSVEITPQGWRFEARAGLTLLTSARLAGVILPSSCRNGTCRTCRCRLLAGRVRYTVDWPGLSAEEKAEGWILPCVVLAESALTIEAPRALDLRPKS